MKDLGWNEEFRVGQEGFGVQFEVLGVGTEGFRMGQKGILGGI